MYTYVNIPDEERGAGFQTGFCFPSPRLHMEQVSDSDCVRIGLRVFVTFFLGRHTITTSFVIIMI